LELVAMVQLVGLMVLLAITLYLMLLLRQVVATVLETLAVAILVVLADQVVVEAQIMALLAVRVTRLVHLQAKEILVDELHLV
jgi:hypothetical protein